MSAALSAIRNAASSVMVERDARVAEIIHRDGPDGAGDVPEDPDQVRRAEIAQHDDAVEARQELRCHAVVEDVFHGQVTGHVEDEAPLQAAVGARHQLAELVGPGLLGDALKHLVIEFFESAAGNKQDVLEC